jgi:hypothetical protein
MMRMTVGNLKQLTLFNYKDLREKADGSKFLFRSPANRVTLTSRKTKVAYREYLETDTTLRREIEGKIGREALLEAVLSPDKNAGENYDVDPSDVPLSMIVSAVTNQQIQPSGTTFGDNPVAVEQVD